VGGGPGFGSLTGGGLQPPNHLQGVAPNIPPGKRILTSMSIPSQPGPMGRPIQPQPHPNILHFSSFLLSSSSPLVHVFGTHGQIGRLRASIVIAYHGIQSFTQSFGTHSFTVKLRHQVKNQENFRPISGGFTGRSAVGTQSGWHQSESQQSKGQTFRSKPGGFGQQAVHHSLSRHAGGGNPGRSLTYAFENGWHHSFSGHLGQILLRIPVGIGVEEREV
jgi:hypothetical protein